MDEDTKQLFENGLEAYREERFEDAVTAFCQGLVQDKNAWEMRFYLAMAYGRLNKSRSARVEFMSIRDLCPDQELRKRAGAAAAAMSGLPT